MPLVRVDMHRTLADKREELSAAIHAGLVEGLDMPADDLFQVFRLHDPGELVYTRTFPDADRTDIIYIQILLARMYTADDKQRMYAALVRQLRGIGIKVDNVLIACTENGGEDWHAPTRADAGAA